MSIIVRLDRVMADRKVSLTELAERIDLTLANLSILKTGKAKAIRFPPRCDMQELSSARGYSGVRFGTEAGSMR